MSDKIERFDNQSSEQIMKLIEEHLQPLADQIGIQISIQDANFNFLNFRACISCKIPGPDANPSFRREVKAFKTHSRSFGLAPSDLGKMFTYLCSDFRIVGLVTRSKQFPILCERNDGMTAKFNAQHIQTLLQELMPKELSTSEQKVARRYK